MAFSITAVIVLLSLILSTQVITLYIQYRLNQDYKGIGYWLLGSFLMALGYMFMPMVKIDKLLGLAMISNPIMILGFICLYYGIKVFPDKTVSKREPITIFVGSSICYYYFMFFDNSISGRTVVITMTLAIVSLLIAKELFFRKDKSLLFSNRFTAGVFFVYVISNSLRGFYTLFSWPVYAYTDQGYSFIYAIIFSIIMSNLWTFGLIIMVNQRLMIDNQINGEKMQMIFNTNIDPQIVSRMHDGFIFDVNDEFITLSGYTKDEIIGTNMRGIKFWNSSSDREEFIGTIKENGLCQNKEYIFRRKDGSAFDGSISARSITIDSEIHMISVIHDITERKAVEVRMATLVEQLEIEKNAAQINARTDSLTKLYNRRYFDTMLRTEFYRLTRSEAALSLIMLDIDYFKKFNDNYGHLAGDQCLEMVSETLRTTVGRSADIVARYGGEEFIVILPELGKEGAMVMGEKIRQGVEALAIPHVKSETAKYITVSVGVVTVEPVDLETPDQVLKMVDDALYEAKDKGRNCCVYVSGDQSDTRPK